MKIFDLQLIKVDQTGQMIIRKGLRLETVQALKNFWATVGINFLVKGQKEQSLNDINLFKMGKYFFWRCISKAF